MPDDQIVSSVEKAGSVSLVLVAKEAIPGRVKTRLMPQISAHAAADVYTLFLHHTRSVCERAAGFCSHLQLVLLFDPPHAMHAWHSWTKWLRLPQTAGDLGERLKQAQATLGQAHNGGCVFLGADAPEITSEHILWAVDAVREARCAMVPSPDGGYVLIGIPTGGPELFDGITWSTAQVAAQTRQAAIRQDADIRELPPIADIDRPGDLSELIDRLHASSRSADHVLRQQLIGAVRSASNGVPSIAK